jgi:hypothetical protein
MKTFTQDGPRCPIVASIALGGTSNHLALEVDEK